MTDTVLHTKYRPKLFKEVVGQDAVVSSLSKMLGRDGSHAYVLAGPSGCGKTTLAYICAHKLGCGPADVLDIDASTHTGVENMRGIQEIIQYKPFSGSEVRAVIIDEAHGLSRQAWNSLLKIVEKPPAHVYWFFCTTEPGKIPQTIKTRCPVFTLKSLPERVIEDRLLFVCEEEGIDMPSDVMGVVVKESRGSMRQGLVNLEMCRDVTDKKTAASVLSTALATEPIMELCRQLANGGGSWARLMGYVEKLDEENPESVRIIVMNYMAAALKNAKGDKGVIHLLKVMEAFAEPYNASERQAPLLLSLGRVMYSD